ncbi:hypothetical protein ACFXO2_37150 [Streptomyces sp. NPDC059152]|uniref:hypothetical protein n=1 Tax=Streptomyces sp. NPDC059152 TaxID=3346742 RepID=UPI00369E3950
MLSEISIETVPEGEAPAGRGRPGRVIPKWLIEHIETSAKKGVCLSALVKANEDEEELRKMLDSVHRSAKFPYRIHQRRVETEEGVRVYFQAERNG